MENKYKNPCWINSNWRLSTQIICSLSVIFFIALSFTITSLYLNQAILENMVFTSSKQLFQQITKSQLNTYLRYKQGLQYSVMNTQQQMNIINRFLTLVNSSSNFTIEQPVECITNKSLLDTYTLKASFCYGLFEGELTELIKPIIQPIMNTTALMIAFHALANFRVTQMGYTHKHPIQYFSMVQDVNLPATYIPHKTNWFTYHLQHSYKDQKTFVTQLPILGFQNDIKVTLTTNITLPSSNFEGVIAKEINFKPSIMDSDSLGLTLYLFNDTGHVIFGKQYLSTQTFFRIYDENITGFDEYDWSQMIKYINGDQVENQCAENLYIPDNTLCLYNSILQEDIIIQISQIWNQPFKILIFQNVKQLQEEQNQQISFIKEEMKTMIELYQILFSTLVFLLLMLTYTANFCVLKQTNCLIKFTFENIEKNSLRVIQSQISNQVQNSWLCSPIILKLVKSMEKLISTSNIPRQKKSDLYDQFDLIDQYGQIELLQQNLAYHLQREVKEYQFNKREQQQYSISDLMPKNSCLNNNNLKLFI